MLHNVQEEIEVPMYKDKEKSIQELYQELQTTHEKYEKQEKRIQEYENKIEDQIATITEQTKQIAKLHQENEAITENNTRLQEMNKELIERVTQDQLKVHDTVRKPHILCLTDSHGKRLEERQGNFRNIHPEFIQRTNLRKGNEYLNTRAGKEAMRRSDAVMILLGTNDMMTEPNANTTESLTTTLVHLINSQKKKAYILEIPPTRTNVNRNIEIKIHNNKIEKLASTSENIQIIKYSHKIEPLPYSEAFQDELHLKGRAIEILIESINESITNPSYKDTDEGVTTEKYAATITTAKKEPQGGPRPQGGSYEWRIRIPETTTGLLLGSKYANKIRLEKTFGVQIQLISSHDHKGDAFFIVSGAKPKVEAATEEIKSSIERALDKEHPRGTMRETRGRARGRGRGRGNDNGRHRSRSPLRPWQDVGHSH